MNCKYCQAEVYIDSDNYELTEKSVIDRWECRQCNCFYATNKDGLPISTSWRVDVDGRQYFIKVYDGCTGNAPTFIIAYHTTNDQGTPYWEEVKRFDFVPKDWTPQNSAHKLKTYLPFL